VSYEPMKTAPRDGSEVIIKANGRSNRAYYLDCSWLREPMKFDAIDLTLPGENVPDCWRTRGGNDIELRDAKGWRPAKT
jgi:hypothetical protein